MTLAPTAARRRARGPLAAALGLGLVMGGCSFYRLQPPPHREDWPSTVDEHSSQLRCTSSYGPALVDTVIGVTLATLAFVERNAITYDTVPNHDANGFPARVSTTGYYHFMPSPTQQVAVPDHVSRGIAISFGVLSVPYLASAIYGYINAYRCRDYKALFGQAP
jgi:hypothetical protein